MRFVHRALLHVRANGFTEVPALARTCEGDTVLSLNGRLFDAQGWLSGETLAGETPWDEPRPNVVQPLRPGTLACLASALARFHLSASSLRPMHADESAPLSRRLAERKKEITVSGDALIANVRLQVTGSDRHAGVRWLELLSKAIALAETMLGEHPAIAHGVSTLCHGDLWPSHVYFDGADFIGLTDFESLCFGSPAFDLSQLILHFNGWTSHDTVLEAYEKVSPLEKEDKAVLPAAAVVDLAFEGEWALNALYGENGCLSAAQREAYEVNVRTLLDSLERIVADLQRSVSVRRGRGGPWGR